MSKQMPLFSSVFLVIVFLAACQACGLIPASLHLFG